MLFSTFLARGPKLDQVTELYTQRFTYILIQTKSSFRLKNVDEFALKNSHNFPSLEIQISLNNIWGEIFWIFWVGEPFTQYIKKGKFLNRSFDSRAIFSLLSLFRRNWSLKKSLESFTFFSETCFKNKIAESREMFKCGWKRVELDTK